LELSVGGVADEVNEETHFFYEMGLKYHIDILPIVSEEAVSGFVASSFLVIAMQFLNCRRD